MRRNKRFMELIDYGRLANARVAGNKNQLRPAAGYDSIKGVKQWSDLWSSPIHFFWNQQPVRCVLLAQREFAHVMLCFPCNKAPPKIAFHASGGLVSLL